MQEAEQVLTPDWDPLDHDRCWVTHVQSGEKGWIVRRVGRVCVKLNRPSCDSTRPYRAVDWKPDLAHRPLSKIQIARIAFEADRQLLHEIGERVKSRRSWNALNEKQRSAWMDKGPARPKLRAELYERVTSLLKDVEVIQ